MWYLIFKESIKCSFLKQYKAKVQENQENVLVTRIPVEDKDLVNTSNWKALFEVTKGNESGQFRMETDPKTNEGLLYVIKVNVFKEIVSRESFQHRKITFLARNKPQMSLMNPFLQNLHFASKFMLQ